MLPKVTGTKPNQRPENLTFISSFFKKKHFFEKKPQQCFTANLFFNPLLEKLLSNKYTGVAMFVQHEETHKHTQVVWCFPQIDTGG
jgi:hypothetical protein